MNGIQQTLFITIVWRYDNERILVSTPISLSKDRLKTKSFYEKYI
jgi:hypothetical protein